MDGIKRNLDGVYFRIERDGKFENVCFSDLTEDEREYIAELRGVKMAGEWWKNLAYHLADCLRRIGDEFDIVSE